MRRDTVASLPKDPNRWPHGVRARYTVGCRCQLCREANNAYEKMRAKERSAGRSNELVSAAEARAYMHEMSKLGLGRRAFHAASGVGDTTLQCVRSGAKTQIRRLTAERILNVGIEALKPHALVPAEVTHHLIKLLVANGYTKSKITQLMGLQSRGLQLKAELIVRRNADKLREIYQMQMSRLNGAQ